MEFSFHESGSFDVLSTLTGTGDPSSLLTLSYSRVEPRSPHHSAARSLRRESGGDAVRPWEEEEEATVQNIRMHCTAIDAIGKSWETVQLMVPGMAAMKLLHMTAFV